MTESLRIVAFNVVPQAYHLVADWATANGHQIVLLVTLPGGSDGRYGPDVQGLLGAVPPEQDVLVTTRLRKTATPVVAALAPDLIVSATFPLRIPQRLVAIPRFGAVNLHPAPLPRGRGPNPMRLIFEGDMTAAGALHRIEPDFDGGAILSLKTRRLPDDLTPDTIMRTWGELLREALDEGVARAATGDYGDPQDESLASYAAPFSDEERWLRWDEPARAIQRRAAALTINGAVARGRIDGAEVTVLAVRAHPAAAPPATPGTMLNRDGNTFTISATDGAIDVTTG